MEGKYTGARYVHSLGEVEAIVEYNKKEKIYYKKEENVRTGKKEKKYQIKINKFQINFYKTISKFKICDTIEENKKLKIFSNLYLPISVTEITNYEVEKEIKEYSKEEAIEIGTKKLEEEIEAEIQNKKSILRKRCRSRRNRRIYRSKCYI